MPKSTKSRHGLVRCTSCRAHIRAAERPSLTECPFCGANLHRARGRILPTGRGGILAASLLAIGASACGGGDAGGDDTTVEPGPDTTGNDNGGGDVNANDNPDVAEDGVAPDEYREDRSDDPPDEPMYGVPPE